MKKVLVRRWSTIAAILVVVLAVIIKNYLASLKEKPRQTEAVEAVPKVKSQLVQNAVNISEIEVNGRIKSKGKIDVYSEVTGKLIEQDKPFKEGNEFRKGEVLLRINDTDFRMNLVASRSSFQSQITKLLADIKLDYPDDFDAWQSYVNNFNPESYLGELPEVTDKQEKNFLISRNVYNQFYAIKSQEAQLSKYIIHAPFDGVVSNANVNAGAILRAGQKIGEFIGTSGFELEVGLSKAELKLITEGDTAVVSGDDMNSSVRGTISRISRNVDPGTQSFKVYIDLDSDQLYEGMYLSGIINGKKFEDSFKVNNYLIQEGNFIYSIQNDSVLMKRQIDPVFRNSEYTLIQGLENGIVIADQIVPGAKENLIVNAIAK